MIGMHMLLTIAPVLQKSSQNGDNSSIHKHQFYCFLYLKMESTAAAFCVLEIGRGKAMRAKREGKFAAVVQVVLDHVPGYPLA